MIVCLQETASTAANGSGDGLFANVEVWPFLFLAPVVGLFVHALRARLAAGRAIWSPEFRERAPSPLGSALRAAVVIALLVLAWMDPRIGSETIRTEKRGIDVICCLDVSRSMLATDLAPTRLERAKRDLQALFGAIEGGDRIALVAFAGEARLLVPLTHDTATLRAFLDPVDWQTVRTGGSDLAKAIDKAVEAIDPASDAASHTAIVLLTDGEDLEGLARDAARAAGIRGVRVHTIGYGSQRGSKITQVDEGGRESFVVSPDGEEVVTALDADGLRALAELGGGGTFLRADAVALPLLELREKRILPAAERVYDTDTVERRRPQFQWLLLPAFVLIALEILLAKGESRR